jgi:hypothetical protein
MADDILATAAAISGVERWRRSGRLAETQAALAAVFRGRRTLVIGAAPQVRVPTPAAYDASVCVNGSPGIARRLGIGCSDLTVIGGYASSQRDALSLANAQAWRGARTRMLWFVRRGDSIQHARTVFTEVGFEFENLQVIGGLLRAAIIGTVCGIELGLGSSDERVSHGVFAAILPLWAGAAEVILAGFSLSGGHSHLDAPTPREHQLGDHRFFALAAERRWPMATTSEELHRRYGYPLRQ